MVAGRGLRGLIVVTAAVGLLAGKALAVPCELPAIASVAAAPELRIAAAAHLQEYTSADKPLTVRGVVPATGWGGVVEDVVARPPALPAPSATDLRATLVALVILVKYLHFRESLSSP